jgi:hypothetical protein
MNSFRKLSISVVMLVIIASALLLNIQTNSSSAEAETLQATPELKWYRGNMHTHSLWSDGDDYLEMIGAWYKERNYDFLVYTDHNVLSNTERWIDIVKNKGGQKAFDKLKARFGEKWVEERTVKGKHEVRLKRYDEVVALLAEKNKYLLIQGEEISDSFGKKPIHMNTTNIQEAIPPMKGKSFVETMQNNVNAVQAQRERTGKPILIHLNHPNFGYAITAEQLMRVRGENFFEVYNGHPAVRNRGDERHASTERIWDIILTKRISELNMPVMYGLATDDGHEYHEIPSGSKKSEPGRGWVMVLSEKLETESLIHSLEAGRFYASSGVTLEKISQSDKGVEIQIKAEEGIQYSIEFIGTKKGYDASSSPMLDKNGKEMSVTRKYSNELGMVLKKTEGTEASYQFQGDEYYVRAKITSTKRHANPSFDGEVEQAWIQPALGPAAPDQKIK